jgi:hypothetical protein
MFDLPPWRRLTPEERVDLVEYLREVRAFMDLADQEYENWMQAAVPAGPRKLTMDGDPTGEHAGVYLWRVADPAREFVQHPTVRGSRSLFAHYALCLEARAAAADIFKAAVELAAIKNPGQDLGEANKRLEEAERERARASQALTELAGRLSEPPPAP